MEISKVIMVSIYRSLPCFDLRIAVIVDIYGYKLFYSDNKYFEGKAKAFGDFRVLEVIHSIWQIAKHIPPVLVQEFSFYILFT